MCIRDSLIPAEESEVAVTAIRVALDQRIEVARAGALAAIRSDRHMYLIEDLIEAARAPHFRDTAYQACEDVLPQLVSTSWRTLRKSCANLRIDGPAADWHRARIKAKRARYAVDAIAGMYGTKAANFSKSLGSITELLGDHQDAYVAQEFLRELASQNTTDGITGYALGLLHGIEVNAEMDARLAFAQIWDNSLKAAHTSELVKSS
jgi:CHAD domain-containing protein